MKQLRRTIRKIILESEEGYIDEHPFFEAVRQYVDEADGDYGAAFIALRHPDGCSTETYISINSEDDTGGIWIDKIEVVKTDTREMHPDCFRKGYAKEMLGALTKAADETGTPLVLIAASEPYYKRMYPNINFPDKDQLAKLYAAFGFKEEYSNYAQVKMSRQPKP